MTCFRYGQRCCGVSRSTEDNTEIIRVPAPIPNLKYGPGSGSSKGKIQPLQPSGCVLLANMFNPLDETGVKWDVDIAQDVSQECRKFGEVQHVHVDAHSRQGYIYLKFSNMRAAQAVVDNFNGRYFGGRIVTANYFPPLQYHKMFPESAASASLPSTPRSVASMVDQLTPRTHR